MYFWTFYEFLSAIKADKYLIFKKKTMYHFEKKFVCGCLCCLYLSNNFVNERKLHNSFDSPGAVDDMLTVS